MKIIRSTKCSLKFSNQGKINTLRIVLNEYGSVVNQFIEKFWAEGVPKKSELLKPVVDYPQTWLSARLRKVAAREAIGMVQSVQNKKKGKKGVPVHSGKSMVVSCTIANLKLPETKKFDSWLHLNSIGNGVILDLPVKFHKHYNRLVELGQRLNSYIITDEHVQFCFEIETGPKKEKVDCIGVDTGINTLASLSTGEQCGTDIKELIEVSKRKKRGSKGHKRAQRTIRQRIDEVAKEVTDKGNLIVVENLKGITKNTKRRLVKNIRRSVGFWNVSYWMKRLQMNCEEKNVSFRTVYARHTSQQCSRCNHTDRRNRNGEMFKCIRCGYEANADVQASLNILNRFLTGPYGAGCKPKEQYSTTLKGTVV